MTNYDILKEYEAHKTPVPSYDHFVELTEKVKENQQLKELLKECKANLIHKKQLLEKLDKLEKPTKELLTKITDTIGGIK